MNKYTFAALMSALMLGACATGGSVGDYAMGDDSAAIKAGRNRASAQVSRAELAQHRRQRTNVSEELDLEAKKRANKQDEVNGTLETVTRGAVAVGATAGVVKMLGNWF